MENIRIQTAQNIDIHYEVAGIGDRLVASIIDTVVQFAYLFALVILFDLADISPGVALSVILYLPVLLYTLLSETLMDGQTIGKRQMNIKVAMIDGSQPALSAYLLRWVLRFVDIGFAFVGVLVMLVTERGQRLGDLAAGTVVIRLKPRVTLNDTIFVALDQDYTPTFPQAEALTDHDMEVVKDVLRALGTRNAGSAILETATYAKGVLERRMAIPPVAMPPQQFLSTVLSDYNYYKGVL